MARVSHKDFSRGLFVAGVRDATPAGFLRQAKGVRTIMKRHVTSRWGSSLLATGAAGVLSSLVRFNDLRYGKIGSQFVVAAGNTLVNVGGITKLNTGNLRYGVGIPTDDTDATQFPQGPAHLFVCGTRVRADGVGIDATQRPFKVDTTGAVTRWGIPAPITASGTPFQCRRGDAELFSIPIESFDQLQQIISGINLGWTLPTNGGAYGLVSNNKQQGSSALQLQIAADQATSISKAISVNLARVGTVESPDQDWIQFWIFVDDPKNVAFVDVLFDVTAGNLTGNQIGTTDGLVDTFSFRILVADPTSEDVGTGLEGTADAPEFADVRTPDDDASENKKKKKKGKNVGEGVSKATAKLIINSLGSTKLANTKTTWTKIRVPKQAFRRSGKAGTGRGWDAVRRVRLTLQSTDQGTSIIYFDDMRLHLGAGMVGKYKGAFTYLNKKTGSRSNPSLIVPVLDEFGKPAVLRRDFIEYISMPTPPPDCGVTHHETWHTIGNGEALLKSREVPAPAPQATDITADFEGLQDSVNSAITDRSSGLPLKTQYLSAEELPFDNGEIPATLLDVCGPHLGRFFLLDADPAQRGRVLYTPPGRLEAIQGTIDCSSTDEALRRVVYWSSQVWAVGQEHWYEISGTTEPFLATRILGVPGIRDVESLVVTPEGILYRAHDGFRRFNGANSQLLFPDPVLPLFRGESVGDSETATGVLSAFGTTTGAAYHHGEYHITDGTLWLALDVASGAWRNVGVVGCRGLAAEAETSKLLAAFSNTLIDWEVPGITTDRGAAIPFAIEMPGTQLEDQSEATKILQRVYLDLNTRGAVLTPKVFYLDGVTPVTLPTIATATRQRVEFAQVRPGDVIGIELSGNVLVAVDVYGVEYDWHQPEVSGSTT